jgi:hypothetical protein
MKFLDHYTWFTSCDSNLEASQRQNQNRDYSTAKFVNYCKEIISTVSLFIVQNFEYIPHPQHTQTGSNSSTIATDSSNGVTNTRCCRYICLRS